MTTILTAAEMRAAEERAIASGVPVEQLMERAGLAAAEAVWRYAGPMPALVLAGPGNNGGDGYVIARALAKRGVPVRVAALGDPATPAARAARASFQGTVAPLDAAAPAPLFIDALFGTGLKRGLDPEVHAVFLRLAEGASVRAAIDLPSGVSSDDGALLSAIPDFDLTISFASLKPAHLLQPAARHMGRIVVADIGVLAESRLWRIERPAIAVPPPEAHKYSRGLVTVMAGAMPGAASLAAGAAARAGAGAVRLQAEQAAINVPNAVIQAPGRPLDRLGDQRIGALLVGPGLAGDETGRRLLGEGLASGHPLVLDAGALRLLADGGREALSGLAEPAILTPHEGEFTHLFGKSEGSRVERAREAAAESGAVIVYKGPDTVVAAPDGRAAIHAGGTGWLASGGSGDVLAGAIAAMRAAGRDPFDAACAGVWLHGRAAELVGPALVADDLLDGLRRAVAECVR